MKKAKVSKYGQWKYPGEDTIIPNANGRITMEGVPYPVLGIDDQGNEQMMMPGGEYKFPGNSVYEIPMMANGGDISIPNLKQVKIKSVPKAQDLGTFKRKPLTQTKLNIPAEFQNNTRLDAWVGMPQQSGLGDFTTHRVPSVYDAVKSGSLGSMEEAVDKYLGYPQDKAISLSEQMGNPGEDPIDNVRHSTAAMYTQQAIKDKIGIPIIGDAAGWLGANAMGIGHELGTIFEDERPWDSKLREAGEDIFNNAMGATLGLLPGTQEEKGNALYNLSVGNWLPDGVVDANGQNNLYFKDEQGNATRLSPQEMYNNMFQKKQGGAMKRVKIKSLPKAQDGWLTDLMQQVSNQAAQYAQNTPSMYEFTEWAHQNVKPDPNYNNSSWYNALNPQKPVEQPAQSQGFTIPEDYYTNLMREENGIDAGLKDGKYYQYPSHEKGTDTIGYGHKLTAEEAKAGKYKKGLTKNEAIALMRQDVQEHLSRATNQYNEKFGKGAFDKLHPDLKVLAIDYVYNGIPISKFPTFFGAAHQYSTTKDPKAKSDAYNTMLKEYVRYDNNKVPLGSRNEYTKRVLTNLKKSGGSQKKKPGFQVLTDANGKYVFVKS